MRSAACLFIVLALSAPAVAEEPTEVGGVPVIDRVKSVQKKPFLKRGRFELAPSFQLSVNDAFFQKLGGGARLAYHLGDAFALRASFARFVTVRTDNVRIAKRDLHSRLFAADLLQLGSADLVWTPMYGKLAVLGGKISYFDLFLSAGLGAAWTDSVDGVHPALSLGGGARFYLSSWLALDFNVTDTLYRERFQSVGGAPLNDLQNAVLVGAGASLWFPFSFKHDSP